MVLVAPSEVALQNCLLLRLMRKRRPRWGLGVPSVQEEVEKVQGQLALSFFRHRHLIAAGSSSLSDVGPMSEEPLAPEGIDHPWARAGCSSCQCAGSR